MNLKIRLKVYIFLHRLFVLLGKRFSSKKKEENYDIMSKTKSNLIITILSMIRLIKTIALFSTYILINATYRYGIQ